eukprot:gene13500-19359_t
MFFSRLCAVVFKTTGGRAWNPPGGLKPLSKGQIRNRKSNMEQTLKNKSVLRMAAANEPAVPTRLYRPLNHWRVLWMKRKLGTTKELLGWDRPERALNEKINALSATLQKLQQISK